MSTEIKVPVLGESVTEATVANWLKAVGDTIELDEPIVELETDKVTLEVNASVAGVLTEILVETDEDVEVGAVLGTIGEASGVKPVAKAEDTKPAVSEAIASTDDEIALSPAVLKLINDNKLDASKIKGSGKNGLILKGDVLEHMESTKSAPAAAATSTPASVAGVPERSEERVKMTRLRSKIADRLKEAQNTAAMLTTFNEVDMTNIMELRNQYKDQFLKRHDTKLGFMSFFAKACVQALKDFPAVNAEIDDGYIVYKNYYDIGIAVGTGNGLVVPVLRDAEHKSFADIEAEIVDLGTRARAGKLGLKELTGGTFTITNGGVFGSLLSTPILNPPQSGILGMHKIEQRPIALNGEVVIRPMMYLAMSYDHRIIDGSEAVSFLVRVKDAIEDPQRLLLDI